MNVLCSICQDALESANDIFVTPCGHVFHFPCLIQWLEKVHNCPQCRQKVKRDSITRLYFNFYNTETVNEDSFTLQQKLDTLSFQIKLKETEYKTCQEENVTLKRQNSGLREEVKKNESEIIQKNSVIHALKEQSHYFKQKCQDLDKVREDKTQLEKTLKLYENVKILMCSTSEDVDKMLSRTTDATTLCTYIGIMKRELSTSLEKRKELRSTLKALQQEVQTLKMQRNGHIEDYVKRIVELEDECMQLQNENGSLKKRSKELRCEDKNNDNSPEKYSKNIVSRKREVDATDDMDVSSLSKIQRLSEKLSVSPKDKNDSIIVVVPNITKTKENEENSPYLPTKSKGILGLKEPASQRSTLYIGPKKIHLSSKKSSSLHKNSRERDPDLTYDGFGGHSKVETFPVPKSMSNKLKRSASETSKTKKIKLKSDTSDNRQLDSYIINLT